jgi:hypothetical protein
MTSCWPFPVRFLIFLKSTAGITGYPLQAYIFMGPVYYQKLKHMVCMLSVTFQLFDDGSTAVGRFFNLVQLSLK